MIGLQYISGILKMVIDLITFEILVIHLPLLLLLLFFTLIEKLIAIYLRPIASVPSVI